MSADPASHWPGKDLGLPETGPGSLAPMGQRVLALLVDWAIATLISATWFNAEPLWTLSIFAMMHLLLVGLLGVSLGKRLLRIQVVRGTSAPGPHRAALRTVLLLLVIPAVVISPDGQALHDRISGTVQLRM